VLVTRVCIITKLLITAGRALQHAPNTDRHFLPDGPVWCLNAKWKQRRHLFGTIATAWDQVKNPTCPNGWQPAPTCRY